MGRVFLTIFLANFFDNLKHLGKLWRSLAPHTLYFPSTFLQKTKQNKTFYWKIWKTHPFMMFWNVISPTLSKACAAHSEFHLSAWAFVKEFLFNHSISITHHANQLPRQNIRCYNINTHGLSTHNALLLQPWRFLYQVIKLLNNLWWAQLATGHQSL